MDLPNEAASGFSFIERSGMVAAVQQ